MKKFLVLYRSTASAMEQMSKATPEQSKAVMDAWMTWAKKAGPAIVDLGSPTGNSQKHTSSAATAGDKTIGGFSILQADSSQKLSDVLQGHPHFMVPGASIEVHEVLPLPGM